jgi:hypothetical protein
MPRPVGPDWIPPGPLGLNAAVSSATSVAAPLLAGFALTLVGLVLQVEEHLRLPGAALALLVAAALALLAAVQLGVWTRQYAVTPDELTQWHPDLGPRDLANAQRGHLLEHAAWYQRFTVAYHAGITLMLAGLTVALVPDDGLDGWRIGAIVLGGLGVAAELIWIWAVRRADDDAAPAWVRQILPSADVYGPRGPGSQAPEHWPAETEASTPAAEEWGYVHARLDSVAGRLDAVHDRVRQLETRNSVSAGGD